MKLHAEQVGLTLGLLFAIIHAAIVLLTTFTGGWVFDLAMLFYHIQLVHTDLPLNLLNLALGTVFALVIGAVIGLLFAVIWNAVDEEL